MKKSQFNQKKLALIYSTLKFANLLKEEKETVVPYSIMVVRQFLVLFVLVRI